MQRGLEGRRIAVFAGAGDDGEQRAATVTRALEGAGALIHVLSAGSADDDDLHGAKYAALVLIGDDATGFDEDPRLVQLTREFLASDKPVAALGGALAVVMESGGAAGRSVAAHEPLKSVLQGAGATCVDDPIVRDDALITARGSVDIQEFATAVVRELSTRLEERDVDETSEQSFPASDPPSGTPTAIGRVSPDRDATA